jgi:hypothetical protein
MYFRKAFEIKRRKPSGLQVKKFKKEQSEVQENVRVRDYFPELIFA